jgi:SET family sugar efflux transporter-like MFS transporter
LFAIAAVAVLNIAVTAALIAQHAKVTVSTEAAAPTSDDQLRLAKLGVVLIVAAFIVLQATNATAMTIMTLYVTETLHLDVIWAGSLSGSLPALKYPPSSSSAG